jgi:hypothetical protein
MAVVLNAKGTSVPYFKIGKTGVTLYQGGNDPHSALGYAVQTNDIWFDTNDKTLKFRTSSNTWDPIADNMGDLTDVDLTGLADGYFLRYNSTTSNWEPHEVAGGLASDWGSVADTALSYDGYTGDVWSVTTATNTANFTGNVAITNNLTVSGDATISGNLTFGNADTDTVALSAEIVSNIIPDADATYNLGSSTKTWNTLHVQDINISNDVNYAQDSKAIFNSALEIYNDGNNTYLDDVGAGTFFYRSGTQTFQNAAGSKTMAVMNAANSVDLNFNGSTKFQTTNTGIEVTGDVITSGTVGSSTTGAMQFPVGTTAQRPGSASSGMVRFNSDTSRFEGYNGSEWINIDIPDDWGSVTETP